MKKLLHEKLRDVQASTGFLLCDLLTETLGIPREKTDICSNRVPAIAGTIADEIEKYYDPKPRDPEGNPVHKDMELDGGVVSHWSVYEDGSWSVFDSNYDEIQCGDKDEPIRLPEPKVLDADGVEIKVGDTVWHKKMGIKFLVTKLPTPDYYSSVEVKTTEPPIYTTGYDPNLLTHREPDSLKKLQQFAVDSAAYAEGSEQDKFMEIADRLTAIMERDA